MSKQSDSTMLADRHTYSNPLFDPKALAKFVAADDDLKFADHSEEAIWLFPNGQLVQPKEKDDEQRTTYHYVIKYYFKYVGLKQVPEVEQKDKYTFNNLVTKGAGVVNLIPETWSALKGDQQDLTETQRKFLQSQRYKVYSYVKNHTITPEYLTKIGAN